MPRRQRDRRRGADSEKQGSHESRRLGAGSILPLLAPFATTVWDYINRGMPLNREGTLTPDEVYGLTAYLLFINGVIPEDQVLDQQNLAAVKMPLGDNYAPLPDWKPRTPRLKGYPY